MKDPVYNISSTGWYVKPLLRQSYPNPFNPSTEIRFQIADYSAKGGSASGGGFVSLGAYDVIGREVAMLVNEVKEPGMCRAQWDAPRGERLGVYPYLYPCVYDWYTLMRLVDDHCIAKRELRNVKWFESGLNGRRSHSDRT